ncbi:hypothetical protein [Klebsiella michiganensis]|uniref:hypothetical protein n=1 Tax=Klebsiella michiganensis TaxID=1134687 RepID=UPI00387E425E
MSLDATGVTLANGCAKKTGNIGGTFRIGDIKIVVKVITGSVEKQADMQRLTARRFHQPTRRLAKFITVSQFMAVLLFTVLTD